jgi:hypothetical protein
VVVGRNDHLAQLVDERELARREERRRSGLRQGVGNAWGTAEEIVFPAICHTCATEHLRRFNTGHLSDAGETTEPHS